MELSNIKWKDRILQLNVDVDETHIQDVSKQIHEINISDRKWQQDLLEFLVNNRVNYDVKFEMPHMQLLLSTYGGEVYSGLGLYDVIRNSETPVEVICEGKIMSMGIILTLAAPIRKAYRNTTFMIHSVSGASFGQVQDMEENVEEVKRLNNILFGIITEKTSIPREKLDDIKEHKYNWFMTADEALRYGLITEIIG